MHQIVFVVRIAAPLLVYFIVIFTVTVTVFVNKHLDFGCRVAAAQNFTAASNNFELAIAVAVATFGADSYAALATTVGPLIEVPVLVALVYMLKLVASRSGRYDDGKTSEPLDAPV